MKFFTHPHRSANIAINLRITLQPESSDPSYKPIELSPRQAEELKVIAEFVAVLD